MILEESLRFTRRYERKFDEKNRICIPADIIRQTDDEGLYLHDVGDDKFLYLYPTSFLKGSFEAQPAPFEAGFDQRSLIKRIQMLADLKEITYDNHHRTIINVGRDRHPADNFVTFQGIGPYVILFLGNENSLLRYTNEHVITPSTLE